jgi:hypothetical protein
MLTKFLNNSTLLNKFVERLKNNIFTVSNILILLY